MTASFAAWHQGFPEFAQLFRWHSAGEVIVMDEPITLDGDSDRMAWAIALLRECASWGLPVRWHGTGTLHEPSGLSALHHLAPPESLDAQLSVAGRWRANHRHGSFHFRQGPGFVQVKDTRGPVHGIRFLLSEADTVRTFTRCLRPSRLTELSEAEQAQAGLLIADGLLYPAGGMAVTLPARMHRWPVPVDAV